VGSDDVTPPAMLTLQEVFDRVAAHLLRQGRRSMHEVPSPIAGVPMMVCAYRGLDGLRCAAGCLMPDEVPVAERTPVTAPANRAALLAGAVDLNLPRMRALISALQWVHDDRCAESWRDELLLVARRYGLSDAAVAGTAPRP
jgi:hypothetical protein